MNLVGLSGLAGAGKDEAAVGLAERDFVRISLADPMKRAAREWFGWSDDALWGPSERRNQPDPRHEGLTPRKVLQRLGTEMGRECYPDVWIDYAIYAARSVLRRGSDYIPQTGLLPPRTTGNWFDGVVIPDVRYRNEIDAIRKAGGVVIRITRPNAGLQGAAALHASEVEQLGIPDEVFDAVVVNDSTIHALREAVINAVHNLGRC